MPNLTKHESFVSFLIHQARTSELLTAGVLAIEILVVPIRHMGTITFTPWSQRTP